MPDLDDVLKKLTADFTKFRATWNTTMTGVQKTFTQAEATVKGMITGAGGAPLSTLTGSLQLLGIQVAQFFLPTVIEMSAALQDAANWLRSLGSEGRKTIGAFAEMAGEVAIAVGAFKLLSWAIDPKVLGFALLAISIKALSDYINEKIERRYVDRAAAQAQQYTKEEVEAHPGFKRAQAMGVEERKAWLDKQIKGIMADIAVAEKSERGPLNPFRPEHGETERINRLYKQQAMYSAIQRALVFGEELPSTVHPAKIPPLGGGLGSLIGSLFGLGGGGGGGGGSGAGGGGRNLLRNWATEMQPRFSPVEEARKQFQLQALKSPLEQQLMQDLRLLAQNFNTLAPKATTFFDRIFGWIPGLGRS